MYNLKISCFFILTLLVSCSKNKTVWTVDNLPNPKQTASWNYVSNPDSVITTGTVAAVDGYLKDLELSTTDQGAVVIVHSIGDRVHEEFATALFRKWGIGDKEKNNGFLLLIVMDQRVMRIETGYGLEGTLPDLATKRIQEEYMVPYMKQGNYDQAVLNGVEQICKILKAGDATQISDQPADQLPISDDTDENGITYSNTYPPEDEYSYDTGGFQSNLFPYLVATFIFWVGHLIVFAAIKYGRKKDFTKKYTTTKHVLLRMLFFDVPYFVLFFVLFKNNMSVLTLFAALYVFLILKSVISQLFTLYWLRKEISGKKREQVYRLTREAYRKWPTFVQFLLPVPVALYFKTLKNAMTRLRNEPVFTADGKPMTKLTEDQEDSFLKEHQIKEEELKAVDYDVWVDETTGTKQIFRYELFSKFETCPKCKALTYSLTATTTLVSATYDSSGKGLRTYTCAFCTFVKKEEYKIPKLERSSSSSSSGGSSSGGSSFGGGSSGGGGSSSSW